MKDTGPEATDATGPGPTGTEQELQDALEALARGVRPARPLPDAYRTARGEWLRRERRRRLVLAVLVAVVFTLATLIGLWVLNQAPAHPGVIFSGTADAVSGASLPRPHP
ncbi:hypothetical protein U5640_34710 [Streptomyces sp. SS7]|uniref:hypothetical protein n=1 Tax=Streptomyces sp. SS7 TaxID=3108485 RepID=UPI0030EB2895